nr:hypothetical protein [Marinicella sp. W31]MDC2880014.1 hypothetical protein [Marinicella sp. W31]
MARQLLVVEVALGGLEHILEVEWQIRGFIFFGLRTDKGQRGFGALLKLSGSNT